MEIFFLHISNVALLFYNETYFKTIIMSEG